MSITILKRSSQGMRSVKLNNGFLYAITFFLVALPIAAGVSGYYYATALDKAAKVEQITIDNWQLEIQQQWAELEAAKQSSQQQINALTARLGMIQAHVRRLDAAGERILSISGIDAKEFNFGSSPAIGGPEKLTNVAPNRINDLDASFNQVNLSLQSREQQLKVLESLLMDNTWALNVIFPADQPQKAGCLLFMVKGAIHSQANLPGMPESILPVLKEIK